jgi:hypothetical protein
MKRSNGLKTFVITWADGKKERVQGENVVNALLRHGYPESVLKTILDWELLEKQYYTAVFP